ncbi:hypothetical protein HK097_006486, partial [Rhizophlyctis rosea]
MELATLATQLDTIGVQEKTASARVVALEAMRDELQNSLKVHKNLCSDLTAQMDELQQDHATAILLLLQKISVDSAFAELKGRKEDLEAACANLEDTRQYLQRKLFEGEETEKQARQIVKDHEDHQSRWDSQEAATDHLMSEVDYLKSREDRLKHENSSLRHRVEALERRSARHTQRGSEYSLDDSEQEMDNLLDPKCPERVATTRDMLRREREYYYDDLHDWKNSGPRLPSPPPRLPSSFDKKPKSNTTGASKQSKPSKPKTTTQSGPLRAAPTSAPAAPQLLKLSSTRKVDPTEETEGTVYKRSLGVYDGYFGDVLRKAGREGLSLGVLKQHVRELVSNSSELKEYLYKFDDMFNLRREALRK